ncbi:MAG: hypothetical protein GEU90_21125 [Gemmatimonas sp.]|nr:hypothetical protein [Gemmatimonas sp.]
MTAVSERLREALELRTMSIQELQLGMARADVDGTKYSNVRRYVVGEGRTPPPLEWIEAAGAVLRVRPAWLAFGDGARTEEEARERRAIEDLDIEALFRGTPLTFYAVLQPDWDREKLGKTFGKWLANEQRLARVHGTPQPVESESARKFAELYVGPLKHWALYPASSYDMHPDRFAAYFDAMMHALTLATPSGRDFEISSHYKESDDG